MNESVATPGAQSPSASLFAGLYQRIPAAILVSVCGGLLGVAAWLEASPAGHGTHTQLGMPSCGFLSAFSLPCATCGMTTAFAHAADGHLLTAFSVQPAAAVAALLSAMLLILGSYALVTGVSLGPVFRYLVRPVVVWTTIALLIGSWLYTIAQYRGLW